MTIRKAEPYAECPVCHCVSERYLEHCPIPSCQSNMPRFRQWVWDVYKDVKFHKDWVRVKRMEKKYKAILFDTQ